MGKSKVVAIAKKGKESIRKNRRAWWLVIKMLL
jgi:hypothetical protein